MESVYRATEHHASAKALKIGNVDELCSELVATRKAEMSSEKGFKSLGSALESDQTS